jgi:titin
MRLSTFTVELWARPTALSGTLYAVLVGRGSSATTNRNYNLYLNGDGHLLFSTHTGTTSQSLKTEPGVVVAGRWTHIVGTYDGGVARIYVNGQVVAENYGWGAVTTTATSPFMLGNSFNVDGATPGFNGALSEVALYSGALSASRISAHFVAAAATNTSPTPPQAVYSNGDIFLTWAAPANTGGWPVTGYFIEFMAPGATTWSSLVANTGTTDTNYRLPGVTQSASGQGYKFRISAITQIGTGAPSAPVGPVATSNVPTAPTAFTATPGLNSVVLTWVAPVNNGGLSINGYRIEQSSDGVTWTTLVASQTLLTYTATNLVSGGSYYFRVRALNDVGAGLAAAVVAGPLGAISGLVATPGSASVALAWLAPPGGGAAPVGYKIEFKLASASTWTTATAVTGAPTGTTTTALNYSVTGLANGSLYDFQISPMNGSPLLPGPGARVSATPVLVVPLTVLLPTAAPSDAQVSLNWLAPQVPSGTTITGYKVESCSADTPAALSACTTTSTNFTVLAASTTSRTYTATGLTNGLFMAFRITPIFSGGSVVAGPVLITATPQATAGSPTNLVATAGVTSVGLSWTAPSVATGVSIAGYMIEYSTNNGASWIVALASTPSGATNFVVPDLIAGTSYVFRVSAVTSLGTGRPSAAASATPFAPAGPPTALVASSGDGSARLSWTAPVSTGGPAITGYRVEISVDGGSSWFEAATVGTVTTATITGLENGVPVLLRAITLTGAYESAPSISASVTPSTAADPPTEVVATSGASQVTLTWLAPLSTGGFSISGYRIEQSLDGVTWTIAIPTTGTTGLSTTVAGLTNGTQYRFRVAALTGAGLGSFSLPVTGTPFGPPSAPRSLAASPGDGQIALSWTAPASDGGSAVTDYRVELSRDGGATWTVVKASTGGATITTIVGLVNGVDVALRVTAVNSAGVGIATAALSVTPYGAPDVPTALVASPGNASVTLSWTAPSSTGGASIIGYTIEQSTDGGSTWAVVVADTGSPTTLRVISGLTNGTAYGFRVSAITRGGTGSPSAAAGATPATIPGSPTVVTASPADRQVTINWAPPVSDGGSSILGYTVERSSNGGSTWTVIATSLTETTFTDAGSLTNGSLYVYRVSALNAFGTGVSSIPVIGIPAARAAAPTNVTSYAGAEQVVLTWTAPSSTGGAPITGYQIESSFDDGETWSIAIADTTSPSTYGVVSGLQPGQLYSFRVAAITAGGTGAVSVAVTGTPLVAAPITIEGSAGDTTATLNWSTPVGVVNVTGYRVERSTNMTTWIVVGSTLASSALSTTVTGLTNGTPVFFRVTVITAAGDASPSNTALVTPAGAPLAGTAPTAVASQGQVTLSWTAPSNNGALITGYLVEYSADNGVTWLAGPSSSGLGSTAVTVTGLTNGTAYKFRFRAINTVGTGAASAEVSATPFTVPTSPRNVTTVAANAQVTVSWTAPASTGGSAITGYLVERSADGGLTWTTLATTAASASNYVSTGLTNGTTYAYRVMAINAAGDGVASSTVTATPFTAASAPTALSATAGNAAATLSWVAPVSTGGLPIVGYRVEISSNGGTSWSVAISDTGTTSTSVTVAGLANGTAYAFRVSALTSPGAGSSSTPATTTPFGAPSAPRSLTVTPSDSQLSLSWSAPASSGGSVLTGYLVEQSFDGGVTWTTVTTTTNTTFAITGLTNGAPMAVRVTAQNAAGFGPDSGAVTSTPFAAPGAPTDLVATAGTGQVSLSWTAPAGNGGSTLLGYRIERSSDGGITWTVAVGSTGSTLTSTVLTGLPGGVTQTFRVAAVSALGSGAFSANASATPVGAPTAPASISVTPANGQVVVSWTAPTTDGGSAVASYQVERSLDGGATWTVAAASVVGLTTTVTGLTNGANYAFRVSARNAGGLGASSAVASATPYTIPGVAATPTAVASDAAVTLSWTTPSTDGGSLVTSYQVEQSANGGTTWTVASATVNGLSTTIGGLANGTTYRFRISARNAAGLGTVSAIVSATPAGFAGAPTALVATPGNAQASLSWTAPTSTGGSAIVGYRIERSTDAGATWTSVVANTGSTATTAIASGLTNGTSYLFRVTAINSGGAGIPSASTVTTPLTVPGAPASLVATGGDTSVTLSWTAPSSDGGSTVSSYAVEMSSNNGATWAVAAGSVGGLGVTIAGLSNGTSYKFRVSARNAAGVGSASSVATTTPTGVSTAPTALTAVAGDGQVSLSWTAPATTGGSAITGYRIDTTSDGGVTWTIAIADTGSTATTRVLTGLSNGTTYGFRIAALTSAGSGLPGASVAATPYGAAATPSALIATPDDGQVSLSWTAPSDTGGAAISGYEIERSVSGGAFTVLIADTASTATSTVIGGLTNGTTYAFRVSARTAGGVGAASSPMSAVPFTSAGSPTAVTAVAAASSVALSWTAPSFDGGRAITGYLVEQSADGGVTWTAAIADTASTNTSATVTGLTSGLIYSFRIAAITTDVPTSRTLIGVRSAVVTSVPFTTPAAPIALAATASDTQVALSWSAPTSNGGAPITGYRIERSTDGGANWIEVTANTGTTSTTALVTGLANGTAYAFRVSARNAAGVGTVSSTIASTPFTSASSPLALAASPGDSSVVLSWSAPTSDGGSPVTGYRIEQSSNGGLNWTVVVVDTASTTTTHAVTGLTNGTAYVFRVSARNASGVGATSSLTSATPASVPAAPTALAATPSDGAVSLTWSAPANTGGSSITGYAIELSSTSGSSWTTAIANTGTSVTAAVITGLTNGINYVFRVSALNAVGISAASATASSTPATIPGTVVSITPMPGDGAVLLTWNAPTTDGGSVVSSYNIERSLDGLNWIVVVSGVVGTSTTISNLTNGTAYWFRVSAVNAVGSGGASAPVVTVPAARPGAPTGVTAVAGDTQIVLSWVAPASNGGSPLTGYTVEYRLAAASTWTTAVSGVVGLSATVDGLTNGSTYIFRVSAVNAIDANAANPVSAVPTGAPSAPSGITAIAGDGEASLNWTAPILNGGTPITGYRVEKSVGGGAWTLVATLTGTSTVVTGLTNGVPVSFRVSAVNAAGIGLADGPVSALPMRAPDAPTAVTAVGLDAAVVLTWVAPVAIGGAPIVGYSVEQTTNGGVTWTTVIADTGNPALMTSIVGLTNGTEVRFRVRSINIAGISSVPSNIAIALPLGPPTGSDRAPTNPAATPGDGQVMLNWTAPLSSGGVPVDGYQIEVSTDGGSTWTLAIADTGTALTSATVTGLTNGVAYAFRIAAIAAGTAGVDSVPVAVQPRGLASAPTNLVANSADQQLSLTWTAPSSNGGAAISGYRIETSTDGSNWVVAVDTAGPATGAVIGGLTNGTSYSVRVSAITFAGVGAASATTTAIPSAVPSRPGTPVAVAGDAQVQLSWSAPSQSGGASITGYIVEMSSDGGMTWSVATTSLTTTATVTGLVNGAPYAFRVRASNVAGASLPSLLAPATPAGPPGAPTNLALIAGNGQVVATWTAPVSTGGLPLVEYIVETSFDGTTWTTVSSGSLALSAVAGGLTNGTPISVRVSARSASGVGASASATATPNFGAVPGAPSALIATPGDAQVSLSWTAPVSSGGTQIIGYVVERSIDNGVTWTTVTANSGSAVTSALVSGLSNGASVAFRVSAINSAGAGAVSGVTTATPRTVPGAPASLGVTVGDGSVVLIWTAPLSDGGSSVTSYTVERSLDGGASWTAITTVNALTTTVSGLANGSVYVFRVRATNVAGSGASSAVVTATPLTAPGQPVGAIATAGDSSVMLTWAAPTTDGGSPVTGYRIERSLGAGGWTVLAASVVGTSYEVSGLTNGTTEQFRITALNNAGSGLPVSTSSVTPRSIPGAPTSLSATLGNGSATITWIAPSTDGGSAITGYIVERSNDGGLTWAGAGSTATTSFVVSGLANGTTYAFRVRAVNVAGQGVASSATSMTPSTVPGAPLNPVATAGDGSVTIVWAAPATDGGLSVSSYIVEQSTDGGISWQTVVTTADRSAVISGLANGSTYRFRISARNAAGTGSSVSLSGAIAPRTPPTAPVNLSVVASDGTAALVWAVPTSDGGAPVTSYVVERSTDGGLTWATATTTSTSGAVLSGLTNGTAYAFRVIAVNAAGSGAPSAPVTATPAAAPGAPTSLVLVSGDGQIALSWSAPSNDGGASISSYRVEMSSDGGTSWAIVASAVTARNFLVVGLTNGTPYQFRVTATNMIGAGASATSSVSATPVTTSSAPTNLVSVSGNGQISLTWVAPVSNGGANITSYVVELSRDGGRTWLSGPTSATPSATVTGLTNGIAYVFRARAINVAGTGAASVWVTAAPVAPPTVPAALTTQSAPGQVTVQWASPVDDGGTAIVGYRLEQSLNGSTWTDTIQLGPDVFAIAPSSRLMSRSSTASGAGQGGDSPQLTSLGTNYVVTGLLSPSGSGLVDATSLTITGLQPGTRYWFRVQSYSVVGDSPWTEVNAFASNPPSPAGIPAVTPSDGSATVTWTPSTNDGGSPVSYLVERSLDGGLTWQTVATTSGTSLTDAPLSNGVGVLYRVTATNAAGSAAPSVSVSVTPEASVVPDEPETPPSSALPYTGSNEAVPFAAMGLILLLLGAGATILARRREKGAQASPESESIFAG